MSHSIHESHSHIHDENCGHQQIQHGDHTDFLHNGHLHSKHESHYDECVLEVSDVNPAECAAVECACAHDGCGHETVPHGDHFDYLVNDRLHHRHENHCDDHGAVQFL